MRFPRRTRRRQGECTQAKKCKSRWIGSDRLSGAACLLRHSNLHSTWRFRPASLWHCSTLGKSTGSFRTYVPPHVCPSTFLSFFTAAWRFNRSDFNLILYPHCYIAVPVRCVPARRSNHPGGQRPLPAAAARGPRETVAGGRAKGQATAVAARPLPALHPLRSLYKERCTLFHLSSRDHDARRRDPCPHHTPSNIKEGSKLYYRVLRAVTKRAGGEGWGSCRAVLLLLLVVVLQPKLRLCSGLCEYS